jgi:hypothetical protein
VAPVFVISPASAPVTAPKAPPAQAALSPRAAKAPLLFGEDLISDKNLDDVILQYLAEEFMQEDKK